MKNETKERWMAGVAAGLLINAGGFVLWRAEIFDKALSFPLKTPINHAGYLYVLGTSALVAAGLIVFRKTRSLGWMLTGCVLVLCSLAVLLLTHIWPDGFNYDKEPFSTGWLGWAVAGLFAAVGLLACLNDKTRNEAGNRDTALIQHLTEEHTATEVQLTAVREYLETVTQGVADAKAALASEQGEHKKTKALRPYESQLVAAFTISLGVAWREKYPGTAFSLNQFQGNRDRDFGDFVGTTQGSCWLIELKRDWSCVDSEFRKPVRLRQFDALQSRPDMIAMATRCHWLGWGESDTKEATLRFIDYWSIWPWPRPPVPPPMSIDNHSFAQRAFADGQADAVGETPTKFAAYMRFLSKYATGDDDTDTIAALIFHCDATGRVRYWIEPNLLSVGEVIAEKYRAVEQQIENQREAERRKPDIGRNHGPSLGR